MDCDQIARELLIALRGSRTQVAWSTALGYRSNVATTWETGRAWPTASGALKAAALAGVDVHAALVSFYGTEPGWLGEVDPTSPEGAARLLDDLRGTASVTGVARRAGLSRTAVSRWLSGRAQPRLPHFLRVVQATSLRLVDFVTALAPPEQLPSVVPLRDALDARRRGAFAHPWTQAVLRALELQAYRELARHRTGWIAAQLGIDAEVERTCLAYLRAGGQIAWDGTHWRHESLVVDTRTHPEIGRHLKAHWSEVAGARLAGDGAFENEVFAVSRANFERIRALHLTTFRALRAIVAESQPEEWVAVTNMQLFALGDPEP